MDFERRPCTMHACVPIQIQALLVQVGGVGDQVPSLIQVIAVVTLLSVVPLMKYPCSVTGVGGHVGGCII